MNVKGKRGWDKPVVKANYVEQSVGIYTLEVHVRIYQFNPITRFRIILTCL